MFIIKTWLFIDQLNLESETYCLYLKPLPQTALRKRTNGLSQLKIDFSEIDFTLS